MVRTVLIITPHKKKKADEVLYWTPLSFSGLDLRKEGEEFLEPHTNPGKMEVGLFTSVVSMNTIVLRFYFLGIYFKKWSFHIRAHPESVTSRKQTQIQCSWVNYLTSNSSPCVECVCIQRLHCSIATLMLRFWISSNTPMLTKPDMLLKKKFLS